MQKKIIWTVGKTAHEFIVEGENLFEVLQEARKIPQQMIKACGLCGNDFLNLISLVTKEGSYEYIKIRCNRCSATLTLGKNRDIKDSYFIRKTADNKFDWQPGVNKEGKPAPKPQVDDETPPPSDEDAPF